MNRYIWPVLMFLCFLAAMVVLPRGASFVPWDAEWYLFNACIVGMIAFWCLCVWDGRWAD